MEPDFSGYVTKAGLKCTDGRTITAEAFKHQDQTRVPLVWNHGHSEASNILGYVDLEHRADGVYGRGYFNDTDNGKHVKLAVQHKDVNFMSIYANGLVEKAISGAKQVLHGMIREVSLVMAGANPGAKIDFVKLAHGDGEFETLEDEAVIYTGLELQHSASPTNSKKEDDVSGMQHAAGDDPTAQDVYDTLNEDQKALLNYMIGAALEGQGGEASHSDLPDDAEPSEIYETLSDQQKTLVHSMLDEVATTVTETVTAEITASVKDGTHVNVFENQKQSTSSLRHDAMMAAREKLTPEAIQTIVKDGERLGSLKESFLVHAGDYGIDNIDYLFPDAKLDGNGVSIISRRNEWVADVLASTHHTPFSRIKSLAADITADEARARGYVKGNMKKDEVIRLLRRTTGPKTIYKKQKLDRDDIIDITDIDIVAWLKAEMRVMLDEEIARAVLIGDGRDADDDDKIDEDHIRPIAFDVDMYTERVNLASSITPDALIDAVVRAQDNYKGTGTPTLYTTKRRLTDMLLSKDTQGRRIYNTPADLAAAMLVDRIVPVEVMEQQPDLVGLLVNLTDYTIGADKGGEINMFDDFDIDFNQQKYLIETRISGALTRPKSAIALFVNAAQIVTPGAVTFVNSTGIATVPAVTGVVYKNKDTGATLTAGAQPSIAIGAGLTVMAYPTAGYGLTHGAEREFEFHRTA